MDAFKISVKIFAESDPTIAADDFLAVFHSWIQRQAVPDHLLIDVADYAHVKDGPGTVLVANEANFYTDRGDGRFGLLYSRKTPVAGDFADRLRQALLAALEACERLESDETLAGRIKFKTNEVLIRINDRLLAPNTVDTFNDVREPVQQVLGSMFAASDVRLTHQPDERALFEVKASTTSSATIAQLLHRLRSPSESAQDPAAAI